MSNPTKYVASSVRTAYIASIIGLTLVLFVLGIGVVGIYTAKSYKKMIVEQTIMDVFFKKQVNDADKMRLEKDIKQMPFVLTADKKSPEEALDIVRGDMDLDEADDLLDESPIPTSIMINIKEEYVSVDSLDKYAALIENNYSDIVLETHYDRITVKNIARKTRTPLIIILSLSGLLLLVAVALIHNTIRLAIYSKRFSLKTMTLVGAKTGFIRRPFLMNAVLQGFLAGVFAVSLIVLVVYLFDKLKFIDFETDNRMDSMSFIYIFGTLILFGVLISFVSTFFALRRYIRIKTDNLY